MSRIIDAGIVEAHVQHPEGRHLHYSNNNNEKNKIQEQYTKPVEHHWCKHSRHFIISLVNWDHFELIFETSLNS